MKGWKGDKKTVVLFEYGGWIIRQQTVFSFSLNAINAKHTDCTSPQSEDKVPSWFHNELPVCSVCDEAVPDEVQGIMQMLIAESPKHTEEYR